MGKTRRNKRDRAAGSKTVPQQLSEPSNVGAGRRLEWLHPGRLYDEGAHTALYPYAKLKEILRPEDVRDALLDETRPLEELIGRVAVDPFYALMWTLNGCAGVFTSHVATAPAGYMPPYPWAKSYVASAVILLSRNRSEHHNVAAGQAAAAELLHTIASSPLRDEEKTTGRYVSVGPVNVIFTNEMSKTTFADTSIITDRPGYGCQLIIGGAANSRLNAASRWSRAVTFVAKTLRLGQHIGGAVPEAPHRHIPD